MTALINLENKTREGSRRQKMKQLKVIQLNGVVKLKPKLEMYYFFIILLFTNQCQIDLKNQKNAALIQMYDEKIEQEIAINIQSKNQY